MSCSVCMACMPRSLMLLGRKFTTASLPPVMGMRDGQGVHLTVDVAAVLQEIRDEAARYEA